MRPDGPIRVLIIDDTPLFGRLLAAELDRCGGVHSVAVGGQTEHLRDHLLQFHPELILLDLGLRQANALVLLQKLRVHYPVPVIVMAQSGADGAVRGVEAIRAGAIEAITKPDNTRPDSLGPIARVLADKMATAIRMVRPVPTHAGSAGPSSFRSSGLDPVQYLIVVGASTGGTKAIESLLEHMPGDFPPVVIVQHMPVGFTRSFAARLNGLCAMSVVEANGGELLRPGMALIARGDTHLVVEPAARRWRTRYTDQRLVNRHCPSVDVLFDSAAAHGGQRAIGILLTGMGADGAKGMLNLRQSGAMTIAQDKQSSVVYGMPKVAVELGAVMHSAPPQEIPGLLLRALRGELRPAGV